MSIQFPFPSAMEAKYAIEYDISCVLPDANDTHQQILDVMRSLGNGIGTECFNLLRPSDAYMHQ